MEIIGVEPSLRRSASAEQRVMEAIRRHFRRSGGAPSYNEISDESGVRRNDIGRQLERLEQRGLLQVQHGVARGIVLTDRTSMLSDLELELAVIARGGRIIWPDPRAQPLAEAYPPLPTGPDCGQDLAELLVQIDHAGGHDQHGDDGTEEGAQGAAHDRAAQDQGA